MPVVVFLHWQVVWFSACCAKAEFTCWCRGSRIQFLRAPTASSLGLHAGLLLKVLGLRTAWWSGFQRPVQRPRRTLGRDRAGGRGRDGGGGGASAKAHGGGSEPGDGFTHGLDYHYQLLPSSPNFDMYTSTVQWLSIIGPKSTFAIILFRQVFQISGRETASVFVAAHVPTVFCNSNLLIVDGILQTVSQLYTKPDPGQLPKWVGDSCS